MKKWLLAAAICLLGACAVQAQNPNGNTQGNSQGWQQSPVLTWQHVHRALREARQWAQQNFGLSLGQMIQQYQAGNLTVELVETNPPSWTLKVGYGGIHIIVVLSDI
ncbi:MAG: hypothetical protein U0176_10490 [Bacteroidia bacterium]